MKKENKYILNNSFKDWLILKEIYESIIENNVLNESPMLISKESFSRLANIIQKKLDEYKFDINKSNEYEQLEKNIYIFHGDDLDDLSNYSLLKGYIFLLYIENNKILGASMLKRVQINNGHNIQHAFEVLITTNFTKIKINGLIYKLYSALSRHYNSYIVSGAEQSPDSKKIWERWLREKENISEIFGWHYKEKKFLDYKQISNFWCSTEKCKERRIVVKFK